MSALNSDEVDGTVAFRSIPEGEDSMRKILEAIGLGALAVLASLPWSAMHGPNHRPVKISTPFDRAAM